MRRIKYTVIFASAMTIALLCTGLLFISARTKDEPISRGIFSWKSGVFEDGGSELFSFMKQHGFTELYQWFSSELNDSEITGFLNAAAREKVGVYLLTGDPSWANDSTGKNQIEMVEKTVRLNKLTPEKVIKGIVFDVEPHLLKDWDKNSSGIFENYLLGMKKAYSKAAFYSLEVIVCIPYHYDNHSLNDELKALIRTGCDRVAVMNYNKGKEIESIKNEISYASDYRKGIVNIYEFKAPGDKGITDANTYHSDGFDAALSNFRELIDAYGHDIAITMAAHDYDALREAMKLYG